MNSIKRRLAKAIFGLGSLVLFTGCCGGSGSWRDRDGQTQGAYLNAMFADIDATKLSQQERKPFAPPANLAVVQVGEVSPPGAMMDQLRSHSNLFRRVEAIPSTANNDSWRYSRPNEDPATSVRSQVNALRNMAASIGMDYLLLVGGTVDQNDSATNLSAFNLTIVGAFVVPSHETRILVKTSGALIDVRTGQVVSISTAEAGDNHLATLASANGDTDAMLERLRVKASVSLADAVATDCVRVGGATPVTSSNLVPAAAVPSNAKVALADPAFTSTPGSRFQGR